MPASGRLPCSFPEAFVRSPPHGHPRAGPGRRRSRQLCARGAPGRRPCSSWAVRAGARVRPRWDGCSLAARPSVPSATEPWQRQSGVGASGGDVASWTDRRTHTHTRHCESNGLLGVFHICRRVGFSSESNLPCYICSKLLVLIPVVRKIMPFVAKHIFSLVTNQWGETYARGAAVPGCPLEDQPPPPLSRAHGSAPPEPLLSARPGWGWLPPRSWAGAGAVGCILPLLQRALPGPRWVSVAGVRGRAAAKPQCWVRASR